MGTTTDANTQLTKSAARPSILRPLVGLTGLSGSALKAYLTAAAAIGALGGAGIGAVTSYVKTKNPKLTALDRKKKFYDRKLEEMENENWLNDVMQLKKRLETSRLSDDERTALEDQYLKLIDKQ